MDSVTYDFEQEQDLLFPIGAVISSAHLYAEGQGFGLWGMAETALLDRNFFVHNAEKILPPHPEPCEAFLPISALHG